MNKERLNEMFYYKEGFLYNKFTRNSRALKDDIVGTLHHSGYYQTQIDKKLYMVHRLIWNMFFGEIDEGMEIDHINHIRNDNRLENLRCVTRQDNRRNQKLTERNKSGQIGVYFIKRLGKWGSQIKVNGKVVWLGSYTEKSDAIKARKNAEVEYNFHKNHGGE